MPIARRNLFSLAERLHRTVGELESTLTLSEYFEWIRYYSQAAGAPKSNDLANASDEQILEAFGI
jgi:hypothetical protein